MVSGWGGLAPPDQEQGPCARPAIPGVHFLLITDHFIDAETEAEDSLSKVMQQTRSRSGIQARMRVENGIEVLTPYFSLCRGQGRGPGSFCPPPHSTVFLHSKNLEQYLAHSTRKPPVILVVVVAVPLTVMPSVIPRAPRGRPRTGGNRRGDLTDSSLRTVVRDTTLEEGRYKGGSERPTEGTPGWLSRKSIAQLLTSGS